MPTLSPASEPSILASSSQTESPSINPDTTRFVGNFDSTDQASCVYSSGTYKIATNPDRSNISQSYFSALYLHNPNVPYDAIIYETSSISSFDLGKYVNKNKKFYVKILSSISQK